MESPAIRNGDDHLAACLALGRRGDLSFSVWCWVMFVRVITEPG